MATLTIRDLDDALKRSLRLRAAAANRSMEEEVRQILRAALRDPAERQANLGTRIRSRFEALGDIQLDIAAREPVRPAPSIEERPARALKSKGAEPKAVVATPVKRSTRAR